MIHFKELFKCLEDQSFLLLNYYEQNKIKTIV